MPFATDVLSFPVRRGRAYHLAHGYRNGATNAVLADEITKYAIVTFRIRSAVATTPTVRSAGGVYGPGPREFPCSKMCKKNQKKLNITNRSREIGLQRENKNHT